MSVNERVMSHEYDTSHMSVNERVMSHFPKARRVRMSHVICEWVMSHCPVALSRHKMWCVRMSHVTRDLNVTSHFPDTMSQCNVSKISMKSLKYHKVISHFPDIISQRNIWEMMSEVNGPTSGEEWSQHTFQTFLSLESEISTDINRHQQKFLNPKP